MYLLSVSIAVILILAAAVLIMVVTRRPNLPYVYISISYALLFAASFIAFALPVGVPLYTGLALSAVLLPFAMFIGKGKNHNSRGVYLLTRGSLSIAFVAMMTGIALY